MPIEICKKILNLEFTERVGRTEYCDHPQLIKHITGIYPKDPEKSALAYRRFYEWVPYDFLWSTNDGPVAVWLNDRKIFSGFGTNPPVADQTSIVVKPQQGRNKISIALDTNNGKAEGIFCRIVREEKL